MISGTSDNHIHLTFIAVLVRFVRGRVVAGLKSIKYTYANISICLCRLSFHLGLLRGWAVVGIDRQSLVSAALACGIDSVLISCCLAPLSRSTYTIGLVILHIHTDSENKNLYV